MDKSERKYFKVEEPMPGFYEISSCLVQRHLFGRKSSCTFG